MFELRLVGEENDHTEELRRGGEVPQVVRQEVQASADRRQRQRGSDVHLQCCVGANLRGHRMKMGTRKREVVMRVNLKVARTDDSERQTSGSGCTFMRISAAATVQLSAIASRSAKLAWSTACSAPRTNIDNTTTGNSRSPGASGGSGGDGG